MNLLFAQNFSFWSIIIAISAISFGLGLLFKQGMVMKQRKRIVRLEDEMLANHSQILYLEQKISEARKNGVKIDYNMSPRKTDRGDLKVS